MIPMNAASLAGLVADAQRGTTGGTDTGAGGFLDALLAALPPEAQGLSLDELVDWLKEQDGGNALAALLPQAAAAPLPAAPELAPREGKQNDPDMLLGLILSSRQMPAAGDDAAMLESGGILDAQAQTGAADDAKPFLQMLTPLAKQAEQPLQAAADLPLRVPVRHPDFSQAVGERLVWLVRNDVQEATIRLDPPHMGPLEISVSVKDDRATVLIHANHAVTRDMLEAEAPRLRGMLGDSGFGAVDVNVARDNARQQQGGGRPNAQAATASPDSDEGLAVRSDVPLVGARGLVDHYA